MRTKLGIYATARISNINSSNVLAGDFTMQAYSPYNADITAQIRRARRRRRYTKKRRLTETEVDHLFPVRTYRDWLDGGAERDADDRDIHAMLKEENDEELVESTPEAPATENSPNSEEPGNAAAAAAAAAANETDASEKTAEKPVESQTEDISKSANAAGENVAPAEAVGSSSNSEMDLGSPNSCNYDIHFDSGTCAICIDAFEPSDQVRGLICGHVFHQDCLDPWLTKRKACCPMCKRDYYLKRPNANGGGGEDAENVEDNENADIDSINNYPELDYATLSERVTEIVQRNPELETVATERIKKYLTLKWRIFWRIMGISKRDLVNSAIVSEDQRQRELLRNSNNPAAANTTNTDYQTNNNEGTDQVGDAGAEAETGTGTEPEQQSEQQRQTQSLDNRNRAETMV